MSRAPVSFALSRNSHVFLLRMRLIWICFLLRLHSKEIFLSEHDREQHTHRDKQEFITINTITFSRSEEGNPTHGSESFKANTFSLKSPDNSGSEAPALSFRHPRLRMPNEYSGLLATLIVGSLLRLHTMKALKFVQR